MAKFIVIDGLDGTGKATQAKLLEAALEKMGYTVHHIEAPNYAENSSWPVKEYLGGSMGDDPSKLNPYMCASFYAVDRMVQYHKNWKHLFELDDSHAIVADRYISANIIHQGAKIQSDTERNRFVEWCYEYEHGLCGMPKEDATIILNVPVEISQKLMSERYDCDESKKDIHERNKAYLENCAAMLGKTMNALRWRQVKFPAPWYDLTCTKYKDRNAVEIEDIFQLADRDTVHKHVMAIVKPALEGKPLEPKTYCCFFGMSQYERR